MMLCHQNFKLQDFIHKNRHGLASLRTHEMPCISFSPPLEVLVHLLPTVKGIVQFRFL